MLLATFMSQIIRYSRLSVNTFKIRKERFQCLIYLVHSRVGLDWSSSYRTLVRCLLWKHLYLIHISSVAKQSVISVCENLAMVQLAPSWFLSFSALKQVIVLHQCCIFLYFYALRVFIIFFLQLLMVKKICQLLSWIENKAVRKTN